MPKEAGGSLGDGASSDRMTQFMHALVRVDLYRQKELPLVKGETMGLFGWCLDGNHDLCFVTIPEHTCKCSCHSESVDA